MLAEYDHSGICVKEYIYAGSKLIAEYRPVTGEYFYYMSDQINSTRIVTDDAGVVVHSAAYSPFGKQMKTWVNTMDPNPKFSGKEREKYSGLDYFGARYYGNQYYRFMSVDPIINKVEALSNPQLWNLYSYCRNNPISYFDPDGRKSIWTKIGEVAEFTAGAVLLIGGAVCDLGTVTLFVAAKPTGGGSLALTPVTVAGSSLAKATGTALIAHSIHRMSQDNQGKDSGGSKGGGSKSSQMKRLSKGEIKKLKKSKIDIHDLKGGKNASKYDLFKDKKGDIFVKPKSGAGPVDHTGLNIKDFK